MIETRVYGDFTSEPCEGEFTMKFRPNFLVAICFFLCFSANAKGEVTAPTHCKSHERVIFSCPFNSGKTVSLCASSDLSKDTGTLQYRFGRIGRKPELSYPQAAGHPSAHFSYYPGEPFGDPIKKWFYGPSRVVSFQADEYVYSLEVFKNTGTAEFYGSVSVKSKSNRGKDSGGVLVDYTCALDRAVDHIDDLDELGIPLHR